MYSDQNAVKPTAMSKLLQECYRERMVLHKRPECQHLDDTVCRASCLTHATLFTGNARWSWYACSNNLLSVVTVHRVVTVLRSWLCCMQDYVEVALLALMSVGVFLHYEVPHGKHVSGGAQHHNHHHLPSMVTWDFIISLDFMSV